MLDEQSEPVEYRFSFKKNSSYKGKSLLNINSSGRFTLLKEKADQDESIFTFKNLEYSSNITKDPLIFSPVAIHYNRKLNLAAIKDKKNFKPQWNRYRDKHRSANNRALLLIVEKLYFNTPLGMEYDILSNGVYLPFFLNEKGMYTENEHYRGLDFLSIPLDIPMETTFLCRCSDEKETHLEGWINLKEEHLDGLLLNQSFRNKAKDYHISRDFTIKSKIEIKLETITNVIKHIKLNYILKGEQDLFEEIDYTVDTDFDSYKDGCFRIFEGKRYTQTEWEEYEKERKKPGRNFSLLDED
ncbi:hypothetical protein [Chryseobacterium indologenes]|uniref:Uncharacterized protein n=1 Tax=Chryseobacterium indologenes TaxID=253 RepID=A0A0N0ZWT9_CHRID|nr:hypothetical protein [Chryseobacterium indologenes]KPE51117.1 hypothetical protein AOB46_10605 [Chryseobacterium indologenes]